MYTAGEGIAITGNVIKATVVKHQLGERYQGGIIFWLDDSGEHGLVASVSDLNHGQGIQWRNGESGNKTTNARADGLNAGEGNTRLIIAAQTIDQQQGEFAARLAANYRVLADGQTVCPTPIPASVPCYGGWYLPSAYELNLLYQALSTTNRVTFAPDFYWSSTEATITQAWMQNFATGEQVASPKPVP